MFKADLSPIKKGIKTYVLSIIIGLLFIGVFIFINVNSQNKIKEYSKATATDIDKNCENKTEVTVSDGGTSVNSSNLCRPIYTFEVDGREYTCKSSTGVDKKLINTSNKTVYYDPSDPSKCLTGADVSSNKFLYIVLAIGVLVLGYGIALIVKTSMRIKAVKQLEQTGTLFKHVKYQLANTNIQVGRRIIQKPIVDLTLPNNQIVNLKGDARYDNNLGNSEYVDVLIDLNNPTKNYYIDYEIQVIGNGPNQIFDLAAPVAPPPPPAPEPIPEPAPGQPTGIAPLLGTVSSPAEQIIETTPTPTIKVLEQHNEQPTGRVVPNIVQELAEKRKAEAEAEAMQIQQSVSPEMMAPAVEIPGVTVPAAAPAPAPVQAPQTPAEEPAVVIPGVNDQPVPQPAPAPVEQPVVPIPITPAAPPQPEVIPVNPVIAPEDPVVSDQTKFPQ